MKRFALATALGFVVTVGPASAQQGPEGHVSGKVIDAATGRPLVNATILVMGTPVQARSNADGTFRTPNVPVGVYSVRAAMIGFKYQQTDSVRVVAGQASVLSFALPIGTVQLEAIVVEAQQVTKSNTDAGLLAIRQAAPVVSDGISAQAMARAPDASAAEAVRRVTGVTLYDGKFLVVRGLGERYSNALLNGADMPNPVVEKKIAPLDLFPASLLDAVVASKTATPDKPGDFAGGSLELTTRDFPENRVTQLSLTQSANDQVTFQRRSLAPRGGTDFLGIDDGRRQPPAVPFENLDVAAQKPILQAFKDTVFNPPARRIGPGLGGSLSYGNQWPMGTSALGSIFSLTYSNKYQYTPNRVYNIFYYGQEGATNVDWGGVGNLSLRWNGHSKFAWRNLYTRSSEETTRSAQGADLNGARQRFYQVRYVERYLWQTQLTGEHRLGFLLNSTIAWKGTFGRARIDDPDNHSASYNTEPSLGTNLSGKRLIRVLSDRTASGQGDWSFPFSLHHAADGLFKFGGAYRSKRRSFDARDLLVGQASSAAETGALGSIVATLRPEEAFSPELMGSYFSFVSPQNHNDSYFADDIVTSGYGMVDLPILAWLRLVGGVRMERWQLALRSGGDDPEGNFRKFGEDSTIRRPSPALGEPEWDVLPSANLSIAVSSRLNIRMAGSRTLARPEAREVSPGKYSPVGGIGACEEVGNQFLRQTHIDNADLRWEFYPRSGEILAVSGFYKYFRNPIIEIRSAGSVNSASGVCTIKNGDYADVRGAEFELERGLDFLPGPLKHLSISGNVTRVWSSIQFADSLGLSARAFVGQSPWVVNGSVSYDLGPAFSFSVLYNYFADRVTNYSNLSRGNNDANVAPAPNPNWVERGRSVIDAKMRVGIGKRLKVSISGKNLSRSPVIVSEDAGMRYLVSRYNPGVSVSTTLTYDF